MSARPRVLYVTDLAYPARGRRYADEDIWLTSRLRTDLDLALCNPRDALGHMDLYDAVIVRNSGAVLGYRDAYERFVDHARATRARVFNSVTGKADMRGKQYLVDLSAAGYPVIPTVDDPAAIARLPVVDQYVMKPKDGADSIGLAVVRADDVLRVARPGMLLQPRIDFAYEVSFYFVDESLAYALYAPDPSRRWALERYSPLEADVSFARRFIAWNDLAHGIQRVDGCRTPSGELLLVELEDLNPWLSLDVLDDATRDAFVTQMLASVRRLLDTAR